MLRIALAVVIDGARKKPDGLIKAALAPGHATVERLNVAERHVIVGMAENRLGGFGDANGIHPFALLKEQPAFEDLHDGRHARMAKLERKIPSLAGIDQGFVIIAAAAQTTSFPVIRDRQQELVVEFFGQAQNEIKMGMAASMASSAMAAMPWAMRRQR